MHTPITHLCFALILLKAVAIGPQSSHQKLKAELN